MSILEKNISVPPPVNERSSTPDSPEGDNQPSTTPSPTPSNPTSDQASLATRMDLLNFTWEELEQQLLSWGQPKYRAHQIFRWLYQELETDINKMTDLPKTLRERLVEEATVGTLTRLQVAASEDGTQKILFRLRDGMRMETVLIPDPPRNTLCVSSQVGCALGCRFCYTASLGPGRNLTLGEYMAQFVEVARLLPPDQSITNVVFMGMGEPLINFDNLMRTLSLLTDDRGLNLGKRRITVSTAGLCPQILKMGQQHPVRLAISLHATTDTQRDELMPINQKYPLKSLFSTLQQYRKLTPTYRLPITLEYTLIANINDSMEDARRLAKLAHSIEGKVNLIPYNEHPGAPYRRPTSSHIEQFLEALKQHHIRATCRITRGDDIYAACGQLAIHGPEDSPESPPFRSNKIRPSLLPEP